MSDYQDVRVLRVRGRTLELEVTECHSDNNALDSILNKLKLKKGGQKGLVKIAAELLVCNDNALVEAGRRIADLREERETGEAPDPDEFIADVALLSVEPLLPTYHLPQYRARLRVTLTRDEYASEFRVGMGWGAIAGPADLPFEAHWECL